MNTVSSLSVLTLKGEGIPPPTVGSGRCEAPAVEKQGSESTTRDKALKALLARILFLCRHYLQFS